MRYHYLPLSAIADARARVPFGPAPAPRYVVLDVTDVPAQDAPKLHADVVAAGGWARCVKSLAEDVQTCQLVETVTVRVLLHGIRGYAAWENGRADDARMILPGRFYSVGVSHEALKIALGLIQVQYGDCPACGVTGIRLRQDGVPRAHKTMLGEKCR